MRHRAATRRRRLKLGWPEWVVVGVIVLIGVVMLFSSFRPDITSPIAAQAVSPSPQPTIAPSVAASPTATPLVTASPTVSASKPVAIIPAAAPPTRLVVSRLHIDDPVKPLPMTDEQRRQRSFVPPNDPFGYSPDLFGEPGSGAKDLTLILGHSCEGLQLCFEEDWQFTRLSNHAQLGDDVSVFTGNGEVCYRVTQIIPGIPYSELGQHTEIVGASAKEVTNRLVLVTCDTTDIHAKNYVVIAELRPCS